MIATIPKRYTKKNLPEKIASDFGPYEVWIVEIDMAADVLGIYSLGERLKRNPCDKELKRWTILGFFKTAKAAEQYAEEIKSKIKR